MVAIAEQFPTTLSSGEIGRVAFATEEIRPWLVPLLGEPEPRLGLPTISELLFRLSFRSRILIATVAAAVAGVIAALTIWPVSSRLVHVLTIVGVWANGPAPRPTTRAAM